mmetsp:Transcript_23556/g.26154  ORF Transcript_23556/g.26154 Transcript_23556/m.26154 type:complete len:246 (+) Transcript_23556:4594-5331(+)
MSARGTLATECAPVRPVPTRGMNATSVRTGVAARTVETVPSRAAAKRSPPVVSSLTLAASSRSSTAPTLAPSTRSPNRWTSATLMRTTMSALAKRALTRAVAATSVVTGRASRSSQRTSAHAVGLQERGPAPVAGQAASESDSAQWRSRNPRTQSILWILATSCPAMRTRPAGRAPPRAKTATTAAATTRADSRASSLSVTAAPGVGAHGPSWTRRCPTRAAIRPRSTSSSTSMSTTLTLCPTPI